MLSKFSKRGEKHNLVGALKVVLYYLCHILSLLILLKCPKLKLFSFLEYNQYTKTSNEK